MDIKEEMEKDKRNFEVESSINATRLYVQQGPIVEPLPVSAVMILLL